MKNQGIEFNLVEEDEELVKLISRMLIQDKKSKLIELCMKFIKYPESPERKAKVMVRVIAMPSADRVIGSLILLLKLIENIDDTQSEFGLNHNEASVYKAVGLSREETAKILREIYEVKGMGSMNSIIYVLNKDLPTLPKGMLLAMLFSLLVKITENAANSICASCWNAKNLKNLLEVVEWGDSEICCFCGLDTNLVESTENKEE